MYSTELFDQGTIQGMLRHFANLLQSATAEPDARLAALAMFSPEELERREADKKKRKQSQFGKLKTVTAEAVGLPKDGPKGQVS